jgi:hypothetical protein
VRLRPGREPDLEALYAAHIDIRNRVSDVVRRRNGSFAT